MFFPNTAMPILLIVMLPNATRLGEEREDKMFTLLDSKCVWLGGKCFSQKLFSTFHSVWFGSDQGRENIHFIRVENCFL